MSTTVRNSYPTVPVVPFRATRITLKEVTDYINQTNYPLEIKASAITIFRIESANGSKGVNNNYGGVQADSGRWGQPWDNKVVATTVVRENQTNRERRFVVWDRWQTGFDFLLDRIWRRGLHINGNARPISNMPIDSLQNLTRAYQKEWVTGLRNAEPSTDTIRTFSSIYNSTVRTLQSLSGEAKKKI